MQRALELAEQGLGYVRPNPLVGCVIVHQERILGEGFHQIYGGPHAEVNAISSVKEASSALLPESTLYVTLEPCAHYGKTPPCAALLVKHKVKRVVIATLDPNPLVAGKGVEILQKAGIEVAVGFMEKEAQWQNRRFFTYINEKRPYIIFKWAQTSDGYMARADYDSKWISSVMSRQLVHKWRAEEAAVMVGTNTAHYDDPQLNVRDWSGNNPVRIVLDRKLRLSADLKLFDQSQATLCFNTLRNDASHNLTLVQLSEDNFWSELMEQLYLHKIQSVLVEGGTAVFEQLRHHNYWDEARVFTSPAYFGEGIPAPHPMGTLTYTDRVDTDHYSLYLNKSIS